MNTADKLRWLVDHGYRQTDIAANTGLTQSVLSRLISGDALDPRESTVLAVDAYFSRVHKRRQKARRV